MGGTLSSDSDYDYYDLGRGRVGRLARKERGRGRGRGGLSPASSTEDLTFQCNHCSGTPGGRHSHNSDCTHRLVPCPFVYNIHLYDKPCDERIEFANFLIDFESKHGQIGVMENDTTKKTSCICFPIKIEAYGRVFIVASITMDGVYYQWVKLLGSLSEAEEFIFSLEYQGPNSTHVFLGEVASMDETLDEMISSGKSSSIGFRIFKTQFMDKLWKYSWSITVKRLD